MKKAKKAVGYLMAVVLCLGMFAGLMRGTAASPAQAEDSYNIVASLPGDSSYYNELVDAVATYYSPYGSIRKLYYKNMSATEQIGQIKDLLADPDEEIDAFIIVPSNDHSLVDTYNDIRSKDIALFVIGDYVNGSPEGTVFFSGDYYSLGVNHAEDLGLSVVEEDEIVVYLFYPPDLRGTLYKEGFLDRMADYEGLCQVTCIEVNDSQDVITALDEWFEEHDGEEVDEIAAYNSGIAQWVIEYYYDKGYRDDVSGTGIRVFSDPVDAPDGFERRYIEHIESTGQMIIETILSLLNGESVPDAEERDGCYILGIEFAPGYTKYVSRI